MGLVDKEKEKKVKESHAHYKHLLGKRLKLPTETQEELDRVHEDSQEVALQLFKACNFKDENQQCERELTGLMNEEYERKCKENADLSERHCSALLNQLSAGLIPQAFMKSGGYEEYKMQLDTIIQKYKDTPGKGIGVPF
ncbi:guanylate-binding protein 1-like [Megalops cyprinoides]|nr:guanylate-binding protein 1-like [Megalops cyprinoides]XP_036372315.1 guanylate-binding protein 1-like [Megalops cyprinoides]